MRVSIVVGGMIPVPISLTKPALNVGAFQVCGKQLRKTIEYLLFDQLSGTSTVIDTVVGPCSRALLNHSVISTLVPGIQGRARFTVP